MPDPESRNRATGSSASSPREIEQREEQEPDDTVFTWPHFLIRHVVVAARHDRGRLRARDRLRRAAARTSRTRTSTPAGGQGPVVLRGPAGAARRTSQPMVAGILIPGAALLFLVALPYLDRSKGWRIRDRKMVVIVFTVLAVSALVLTVDRRVLPWPRVVVGLAVAAPLPGAVAMADERRTRARQRPGSDDRRTAGTFLNDDLEGPRRGARRRGRVDELRHPEPEPRPRGSAAIVDAGPVEDYLDRGHGQVLPGRSLLRDPVPGRPACAVPEVPAPRLQGAVARRGVRRASSAPATAASTT